MLEKMDMKHNAEMTHYAYKRAWSIEDGFWVFPHGL